MNNYRDSSLSQRRKRPTDMFLYALIYLCAAFAVLLLAGIIIYVLIRGISSVNWGFLTTVTSVRKGTVGIAGNIVNTILIVLLTMVIVTPVGVGAAIYLNEYAKPGKLVPSKHFSAKMWKKQNRLCRMMNL